PTPTPRPAVSADPESLLRDHDGLVHHVLHRTFAAATSDRDDLLQEGRLGLLEAGQRFDPAVGSSFAGFAVPWIRGRMLRYHRDHSRAIRIPSHVRDRLALVHRAIEGLRDAGIDDPTPTEIADALAWNVGDVLALLPLRAPVQSTDAPIGGDQGPTRAVHLPDPHDPVATFVDTEARRTVAALLLDLLDDLERKVLSLRCGFGHGGPRSLAEVGAEVGYTREWVRQVEARALARLRHAALGLALDDLAVAA
ncbi:MAG: sigma-70 family RNA polymerase sigma factor, partial [Actinomycetota bacterium]